MSATHATMKLLNVREVADRLRCSRALVYQLCEKGRLSHHRLGIGRGTIRVSEADLQTFLDGSHVEPPMAEPRRVLKHIQLT